MSPPEKTLREVGIRPGWAVLDFGCGFGRHALAAARLVGESGRVYAVDRDRTRLARLRKLAARQGLSNLQTILSDCSTGLERESIDAVLFYDVLHALAQPARVLTELARVLKPGGLLSVSDHHLNQARIMSLLATGDQFRLVKRGRRTYTFARKESSA